MACYTREHEFKKLDKLILGKLHIGLRPGGTEKGNTQADRGRE